MSIDLGLGLIHKDILFEFHDSVTKDGRFKHESDLIVVPNGDESQEALNTCRFVTILAVGPECSDTVAPGMTVLLKNLQWTPGFEVQGRKMWKTNEDQVLAIVDIED